MKTLAAIVIFLTIGVGAALAQSTAFTYQGFLKDGSTPASGNYAISISLWDAETGGAFINSNTYPTVAVVNGVFTVELDFGESAFSTSAARYVEVAVKPIGGATFTTLTPRTRVRSVPASIQSLNSTKLGGVSAASYVLTTDPRLADVREPSPNSPYYIQNGVNPQASSNFYVSGNGSVVGTLSGGIVNAFTQFNIGGARVLASPGNNNVFVGKDAGFADVATEGNSFFGSGAGYSNDVGNGNSFFGFNAGRSSSGQNNAFFGIEAGFATTDGNSNAFFGPGSGKANTSGGFNSFLGPAAGNANTVGQNNVFIGRESGISNITGNTNTTIGAYTNLSSSGLTNATALGSRAFVSQSNSLVLGSISGVNDATENTNVGIGTTTPEFRLDVGGRIRLKQNTGSTGTANTAGIWLFQNTPSAERGFVGMKDDNNIGLYGNNGGGWSLFTDVSTGVTTVAGLGSAGSTTLCRNASSQISTCSSSARYKDNINTFTSGLDLIRRLRPVTFNWKDGGMADMGLVAEEVAEVEPLLTSTNSKGEVEGVKYDRVGVVLVNAVKEQQAQIEAQQQMILDLEKQNRLLQQQIELLTKLVCSGKAVPKSCENFGVQN